MLTALKSNLNVWGYKKTVQAHLTAWINARILSKVNSSTSKACTNRELYASEVGPVVNASADPFAKFIEGLEFGPQLSVSSRLRLLSPQAANF